MYYPAVTMTIVHIDAIDILPIHLFMKNFSPLLNVKFGSGTIYR